MTHSATEINESSFGKKDNVPAIGKGEPVNLRLDVSLLHGVLLQPLDVDFAVKVTNVANDGIVPHSIR